MTSLLKIDRPPAAEHWSRMQHPDVTRTARKLFAFLRGTVAWNYGPGRKAVKYYIEDGITRDVGLKIASNHGSAFGRKYNIEVVNAFFDYVERNPIDGLRAFTELVEWFPIAPRAAIPIKPLSVTREGGSFVPNFFNPWSEIAFDDYQASLYMTVLEKSLFRLTDFESSPGRIIFLPKVEVAPGTWQRSPVIWKRGQFPLLSDAELNDQIRIFSESKEIARVWYQNYLDRKPK
jgi:hypothetical protein